MNTDIEKRLADLETLVGKLAEMAGLKEPETIKQGKEIAKSIPQELLKELGVMVINFDPNSKQPWFQMICVTGSAISVKKRENDFRIRQRDASGKLLKEATPSYNGLVAALNSLK